MRAIILKRIVNGAVWIISGVVVIIVRTSLRQGGSILVWEIIGGGMVTYGAGRLVWALTKASSTGTASV